jgi:hypothetical protein
MLFSRSKCIIVAMVLLLSRFASSPAFASPTPLLDQGPLGAELRAVAPTRLASIESQLQSIISVAQPRQYPANDNTPLVSPSRQSPMRAYIEGDSAQPTYKGGSTPTPAEKRELAANPAFARAYAVRPAETLLLLRRAERIIEDAQK